VTSEPDHHDHGETERNSPAAWDTRYTDRDQVWSGEPNGALVTETADLPPGRALDVGCGEGADAVWLSRRGWQVTALDVSQVALARAARAAARGAGPGASGEIQWLLAGLPGAPLQPGTFDLVSAQYPALLRTPQDDAERSLLALVAPGGVLLVVHHVDRDREHGRAHGFDPEDYVAPADVAALLDAGWDVEVHEERPRAVSGGAGSHHTVDVVLKARRRWPVL